MSEIRDDFISAMKQTIIDYALLSSSERQRLNLEALAPLLEIPKWSDELRKDVFHRELFQSWPVNVDMAREEIAWTLQTLSANSLELSGLWIGSSFASQLLVNISGDDFQDMLPVEPEQFQQLQFQCCETLKAALWTTWVPKSVSRMNMFIHLIGDAWLAYSAESCPSVQFSVSVMLV